MQRQEHRPQAPPPWRRRRERVIAAAGLALAMLAGCGGDVRGPDGELLEETGGGGDDTPCAVCSSFGISDVLERGRSWCPGEKEKFDALFDCACDADTCRNPPDYTYGCYLESVNDGSLCEGGAVLSQCKPCLIEQCTEVAAACKITTP